MVNSPCISICKIVGKFSLNPSKEICQGCGRTLYEIKMWTSFSDDVKLEIIELSELRKAKMNIIRGERDE